MSVKYFRYAVICALMGLLAACAATPPKRATTYEKINAELTQAMVSNARPATPEAVNQALMPPLKIEIPRPNPKGADQRFDIAVSGAAASQVFLGLVIGTPYSMLVHPDVTGTISVNLRNVTVFEALDAIRELYGYDYKVDGTRIFIRPLSIQTRVFQINYLSGQRKGTSETRVTSGSVSDSSSGQTSTSASTASTTSGSQSKTLESSRIETTTNTDFWTEMGNSIRAIVGTEGGRSVVVSPQSGVLVVRAMPNELRSVEQFLRAAQISVERQVVLEAKILEVQLSDGYQTGINWAAFRTGPNSRVSIGQINPDTVLVPKGVTVPNVSPGGEIYNNNLASLPGSSLLTGSVAALGGSLFGLAFQTGSFAALISFLETQGNVHVLSSPRIATLNNQKAVLKVGVDEFFVTGVTNNTTTGAGATTSTPTVTVQPFFSGIALDVTPQIDENNNIILHIHPSVSQVSTATKQVTVGNQLVTLPLASSNVSETDSIVRARDGQIIAIGGLMRETMTEDRSQVPALGDIPFVGSLFRQTNQSSTKRELVLLLKPTVIQNSASWNDTLAESQRGVQKLDRGFSYGGKAEVFGVGGEQRP